MKYVLMFAGSTDEQAQWEKLTKEQLELAYANVNKWFEEYGTPPSAHCWSEN
ncbi:MAG: hypothetical protein ABI334_03230 [Candidatus Dormiibacterota bacterium]